MTVAAVVQARIRELRAEQGLTQEQLCERAGISVDAVTRIENGSRVPTLATLERIASALGTRLADLLDTGPARAPARAAAVARIAALLDEQPGVVQEAAEATVRVLVKVLRPLTEKTTRTKRGRH